MARPYPKFTYEDYLLLPEDKRYEIIGGELALVPSPGFKHQEILGRLHVVLRQFVEKKALGKVCISPPDVVLSKINVVQPDLFFISKERFPVITEKNIQGPPDLVVEILSSDPEKDKIIKRKPYAKFGVTEYWIVDPEEKSIEVMELEEKGFRTVSIFKSQDVLASKTFSDLDLNIEEVFA